MYTGFCVQKRVQSSTVDQSGSRLHRWSRASVSARAAKNKLGMLPVCAVLKTVLYCLPLLIIHCSDLDHVIGSRYKIFIASCYLPVLPMLSANQHVFMHHLWIHKTDPS